MGIQDSTTAEFYVDGVLEDSATEGPGVIQGLALMIRRDGAGGVDGFFYEFLVYDAEKVTERIGIESNINDFYSIF